MKTSELRWNFEVVPQLEDISTESMIKKAKKSTDEEGKYFGGISLRFILG